VTEYSRHCPGTPFSSARPAVCERDPGPGDEVFDRLRHQYLTACRQRGDPCADRDRDPGYLGIEHLAFAGMQA
jgi:hypothetical protein